MTVRILSYCASTLGAPLQPRLANQDIIAYARQELDGKLKNVINALSKALARDDGRYDATFFTLPEFFWNISWHHIHNEDELCQLTAFYLSSTSGYVNQLIAAFPYDKSKPGSDITFLAGTCGTLIRCNDLEVPYYQSVNWLLCGNNASGAAKLSMWPKRHVSTIDYFQTAVAEPDSPFMLTWLHTAQATPIRILPVSDAAPESLTQPAQRNQFVNRTPGGVQFGVDICLDYALARGRYDQRADERQHADCSIDFLLACGMPLYGSHRGPLPAALRYIVRNDGWGTDDHSPPDQKKCQVYDMQARQLMFPVCHTPPEIYHFRLADVPLHP